MNCYFTMLCEYTKYNRNRMKRNIFALAIWFYFISYCRERESVVVLFVKKP